jgi:hypothetical protein
MTIDEWGLEGQDGPQPALPAPGESGPDGRGEPGPDDETELYFPNVLEFVREQLAPMYRRSLDGRSRAWCPQWWRHPEALARLDALWRAWEHLRQDAATGMSVWFRDHADHHMQVLFDADGPFKGCSPDKGHTGRLEPLPMDDYPAALSAALSQ